MVSFPAKLDNLKIENASDPLCLRQGWHLYRVFVYIDLSAHF